MDVQLIWMQGFKVDGAIWGIDGLTSGWIKNFNSCRW